MHETSKSVQRRLHDPNFISRYFRGDGIDIGAGNDPLGEYIELFPLMVSCLSYDKDDGDAQIMADYDDAQFDFVHSSHCLEDMRDPTTALQNWFRILKPGGHLIVTVPDEDMYEQGVFPSTFNPDHKNSFTIQKASSWSCASVNVVSLLRDLGAFAEIIKIERLTGTYRYGLTRQDQTRTPVGEAAIEFVVRKSSGFLRESDIKRVASKTAARKIVLHRPGAIGDIIMTLALVPALKEANPDADIYYACNSAIGASLFRLMKMAGVKGGFDCARIGERQREFDKVINLIGYPLQEGYPDKPMRKHLIHYFADEMGVSVSETSVPHLTLTARPRMQDLPPKYATIHPRAGWSHYKNWSFENWESVIAARPDIWFFQIGAEGDYKLAGANHKFMGKPIDHSIDLMAHADMHLGIDSWTNHVMNIKWLGPVDETGDHTFKRFTPALILWGSTQATAAGYERNSNISLGLPCQPCFREDPKISRMPRDQCINPPGQDYDHPKHACMSGISVERVIAELDALNALQTAHTTPQA